SFKQRLSVEKMQDRAAIKEMLWTAEQETLREEELCISPEYFYNLRFQYPQITHIDIQWKRGDYINELSLYRYTVIVYVGIEKQKLQGSWQIWNSEESKVSVLEQLKNRREFVGIKDVVNP